MIDIGFVFGIVFILVTVILILLPKQSLLKVIRKDFDPSFNPRRAGNAYLSRAYYSILILVSFIISTGLIFGLKYLSE